MAACPLWHAAVALFGDCGLCSRWAIATLGVNNFFVAFSVMVWQECSNFVVGLGAAGVMAARN